jgi:hypothetical protein
MMHFARKWGVAGNVKSSEFQHGNNKTGNGQGQAEHQRMKR